MSDEEALLAAIAAHPEEDTPRLAFADWLEEHGEAIRAEFIRVQVEVARVETLPRIDINQHVQLFRRQQDLLDNHRHELVGPLAKLGDQAMFEFDRGLLSEVTLKFSVFYRHRDRIEAARPLPRVVVHDVTPRIRNMLGIRLPDHFSDPFAHLVAAIGTIPPRTLSERIESRRGPELEPIEFRPVVWPRLTDLDLSGCHLGDANTARLLRADLFPALERLDISANYLTDELVSTLLASGLPRRLKRLILGGNPLTDHVARELVNRWPTGEDDVLETLNLRFTNIGTPGRQALLARFGGRVDLF
jgi:uncharacterized protein (TIGR02996 family)